ncbi:MAG: tetratricopeptide repeat protein [Cyanobacteria bacterium SZAS-4]|nr:tetratricopeptide repeat protein [Cyanobacteria bacterium SZAS-4]
MNTTNVKRITGLLLAATIGLSTALASGATGPAPVSPDFSPNGSPNVPPNVSSSPRENGPWSKGNQFSPTSISSGSTLPEKSAGKITKAETLDETYRRNGDSKLSDGDFVAALDEYDKALQVNPKNAMAYYGRGRVRLATSNYTEARVDLNRALTIDANLSSARLALIGILMYTRDFATGVAEATKVIQSDPQSALAYYERGICNGEIGKRNEAISDLSEAKILLSAMNDSVGCDFVNFSLGKQYQENGRYAAYQKDYVTALKDFDLALNVNSQSAATLLAKASVEHEMGSDDAALADYNKAIEVAPLLSDAYKQRGSFYYETAAYKLAQEDFTKALAISPTDSELYNYRGRALEALGNQQEAFADYKQAEVAAKTHEKQDVETLTKTITDLVQKV